MGKDSVATGIFSLLCTFVFFWGLCTFLVSFINDSFINKDVFRAFQWLPVNCITDTIYWKYSYVCWSDINTLKATDTEKILLKMREYMDQIVIILALMLSRFYIWLKLWKKQTKEEKDLQSWEINRELNYLKEKYPGFEDWLYPDPEYKPKEWESMDMSLEDLKWFQAQYEAELANTSNSNN